MYFVLNIWTQCYLSPWDCFSRTFEALWNPWSFWKSALNLGCCSDSHHLLTTRVRHPVRIIAVYPCEAAFLTFLEPNPNQIESKKQNQNWYGCLLQFLAGSDIINLFSKCNSTFIVDCKLWVMYRSHTKNNEQHYFFHKLLEYIVESNSKMFHAGCICWSFYVQLFPALPLCYYSESLKKMCCGSTPSNPFRRVEVRATWGCIFDYGEVR